ncbi:MAG: metal ABC transporter permease [Deltaproteobacteria bacterium]|nr:metal ABC transporter permease [Deltaproteobacteria bacterium]
MGILDIMAAPFAECMVLVAIHTYLGIHVLRRRVIFVDLALAQTAALGTTVGFLFGITPETTAALIFSMVFTFIGAAIFALTRIRGERVPQEAVIGLFYAIMAASAVLVVQKTHGAEHMDDILVGSILWVKWSDVGIAALAYAFIGLIHYIFKKQFLLISENPDEAYKRGMNVKAWDFLFYLTFGFVISFSVRVAGVLLVFVFLVAPAIMAFIITERLKPQLLIGWAMGTVVTTLGLLISYTADLPSGPTVVSFYGVVLVFGALLVYVFRAREKKRVLGWIGIGSVLAAFTFMCIFGFGRWLATTSLASSEDLHHVEEEISRDEKAVKSIVADRRALAVQDMKNWFLGSIPEEKLNAYYEIDDHDSRLEFIRTEIGTRPGPGLAMLVHFLDIERPTLFFRAEAVELLREKIGKDFGYDPEVGRGMNKAALDAMRRELVHKQGVRK